MESGTTNENDDDEAHRYVVLGFQHVVDVLLELMKGIN
jgi:hypothetical protein